MTPAHLERLCADFDLGSPRTLEAHVVGVLNDNFIVETDRGRYFVKSVREKRKTHVSYIGAVETYMHRKGIPAVCLLLAVSGDLWVAYDDSVYTVYPFLEHAADHPYSMNEYRAMGAMLARIHVAGSSPVPEFLAGHVWKGKPLEAVRQILEERYEQIRQSDRTPTDEAFSEYIALKLSKLRQLEALSPLTVDTLVHGDYHGDNLLFDAETKEIKGVCDWEQAAMSQRSYEVARSLLYTCFEGVWEQGTALRASSHFLEGYQSIFPLSTEEFRKGMQARLERMLAAVWIEHEYYALGNTRANKFIPHELRFIHEFIEGNMLAEVCALAVPTA